jgi:hypothetical protein
MGMLRGDLARRAPLTLADQRSRRSPDSILDAQRGIAVGDESLTGSERGSIAEGEKPKRSGGG